MVLLSRYLVTAQLSFAKLTDLCSETNEPRQENKEQECLLILVSYIYCRYKTQGPLNHEHVWFNAPTRFFVFFLYLQPYHPPRCIEYNSPPSRLLHVIFD